jgi:hypothetical protein
MVKEVRRRSTAVLTMNQTAHCIRGGLRGFNRFLYLSFKRTA